MGASPETLLEAKKNLVNTMSLAGTKQEGEEWTDKEIEEQDLVTQTIKRAFNKANCKELNIEGPNTIKAGQVQHLHTHISAILNKSDDWKPLLQTLHPTPAVCGIPTEEARKFIVENEKYNRAYYTGFLGVLAENKKQFFVNLRCMEIFEETALLYIGGGITAKSNLEKEWQETERKSLTLANHLN
jgi:isochorismate synthase